MGLISKIEDKLSSNKDHSQDSKYDDQSSNSHLRHPVSSGTTSGTYGSSNTGGTGGHGLSSSGYDSGATTGVGRDGYGSTTGGYGSSSDRTDPRDAVSSGGIGSGHHTTGGYDSTGRTDRTDPRDVGLSSGRDTGPREPYDPYSSRGQTTAANASHGTSRSDYGSSNTYANDPNVPRSREGGVLNPGSHSAAHNHDAIPTAGGQKVGGSNVNDPYYTGSSGRDDPYSTSTQHSSGHPIRDAALGGVAGGAASSAMGSHSHHDSSHNPQDVSHMNRSNERGHMGGSGMAPTSHTGGMGSGMEPSSHTGGMMGSGSGTGWTGQTGGTTGNDPDKMGAAYAKGYRDAMEHAKEQMGR